MAKKACNFIKKRLEHIGFLWVMRGFFLQNTSAGCFWKYYGLIIEEEWQLLFLFFFFLKHLFIQLNVPFSKSDGSQMI